MTAAKIGLLFAVFCYFLFSKIRASRVGQATNLVGESHPFTPWLYGADTNSQDTREEDSPKSGMSQFSRVTSPRSTNCRFGYRK